MVGEEQGRLPGADPYQVGVGALQGHGPRVTAQDAHHPAGQPLDALQDRRHAYTRRKPSAELAAGPRRGVETGRGQRAARRSASGAGGGAGRHVTPPGLRRRRREAGGGRGRVARGARRLEARLRPAGRALPRVTEPGAFTGVCGQVIPVDERPFDPGSLVAEHRAGRCGGRCGTLDPGAGGLLLSGSGGAWAGRGRGRGQNAVRPLSRRQLVFPQCLPPG